MVDDGIMNLWMNGLRMRNPLLQRREHVQLIA